MPFWRTRCREIATAFPSTLIEHADYLALVDPPSIAVRTDADGTASLLGTVFRRGETVARRSLTSEETFEMVATRGASLIRAFWGNYIAITSSSERTEVVRAPFGDLAAYYLRNTGATLVASHVDLLVEASRERPKIAWKSIAKYLIAPDIRHAETCLSSVMELAGGDRLTCGGSDQPESLWSPWTFVRRVHRYDGHGAAAEQLRAVILDTVRARTSDTTSAILLLSGGLDSSIVAAALAAADCTTTALNMVANQFAGDERHYARRVAKHCGMPLYDVFRDPASVDLRRSLAAHLPYPSERSFSQATRLAAAQLREQTGADVVIHGGGGDHIFCSLKSAAPLADLIATHGLGRRAIALTNDIAQHAQTTNVAVIRQALARLIARRTIYRWPVSTDFLTPATRASVSTALDHIWLKPPSGVGSGSAGHVALVLGALGVAQSAHASSAWRAILIAQPVIETCLMIPPWLWFDRGENRAAARNAFSGMLPEGHAWRPGKGVVDSFLIELFDANRALLRTMVAEGQLARQGLIDRAAVLSVIDDAGPVRGSAWGHILLFADVEAWATSWG